MTRDPDATPSTSFRIARRGLLTAVPGVLVPLAGCSTSDDPGGGDPTTDDGSGDGGSDDSGDGSDGSGDGSDDGSGDGSTSDGELDLREANVTAVSFEASDGAYSFDVELYHDDDGEDGYADWWQVERLDGEQLGRRTLLHAHGTRRFTRSETIEVPDDVAEVVVRGHDQTHGYGGRAAIVAMGSGDVEFVDQGPEPRDFSDR